MSEKPVIRNLNGGTFSDEDALTLNVLANGMNRMLVGHRIEVVTGVLVCLVASLAANREPEFSRERAVAFVLGHFTDEVVQTIASVADSKEGKA